MDFGDGKKDVVDPEVRAYVSSLVTALGGNGADEEGRYVLGDDALACLRDLKRWLKLYDEKANRLDVARCLAELNLVGGDLLPILALWPENETDNRLKSKTALSCLELLVPLTWPIEKDAAQMTINHHRHMPYLQLAQVGYKRSVLGFDGARILHTAVRTALPSMAESPGERKTRDQGIIKLMLYFLRNVAMITPPANGRYDGDESEISRSATIDAFDYQDIFHLLLTMASTMGEDFNTQDVIVMEIIFYLVKGVDVEKLFMSEEQLGNSLGDELAALRNKEKGMKRGYARTAPSRHNRFGTMIWVKRDDAKYSAVSGQDALLNSSRSLDKMDKTKKFKPPRRAPKDEAGPHGFDVPVSLTASANKQLRHFVEEFLDSGFNPLFQHIRKAMDREAERVLGYHQSQFFYLVAWFLEAERVRRKYKKPPQSKKPTAAPSEDLDSFSLVAGVLNQEMFVTLSRAMDTDYQNKAWQDLKATMKCFTQILLTVQEMADSPLEEDQEIAENILSRIFYEKTTHDMVAGITTSYKDQGFGYLDAVTDLTHNYLRILEAYSKQNVDMQVRVRRTVRRKKKQRKAEGASNGEDAPNDDEEFGDSEAEDEAHAQKTSSERKFDFKGTASRFLSQGCVDTFMAFLKYYNELTPAQLKRVHRYLYRVCFKMDWSVMVFRVDIIHLLHKLIKGPEGLDPALPVFKEWEELVKQILKKCIRKIEERPQLIIEMLFSKINSTAHYLEYGYEKQTASARPRPAAEMEIRPGLKTAWQDNDAHGQQFDPVLDGIKVVVSAMLDRGEGELLEWVKEQLFEAQTERGIWEQANRPDPEAVPSIENPDGADAPTDAPTDAPSEWMRPQAPTILLKQTSPVIKTALFKNGYLRLLLSLMDIHRTSDVEDPQTIWLIPSAITAAKLQEFLTSVREIEFKGGETMPSGNAEDWIRRKSAIRRRAAFDDEDGGLGSDDDDEELLFPAGGPTNMPRSEALKKLKKKHRVRRRKVDSEGEEIEPSDGELEEKRRKRKEKELEKMRRFKSDLYIHDSDEASDEERDRFFFEEEEKRRLKMGERVVKEMLIASSGVRLGKEKSKAKGKGKKRVVEEESESDEDAAPRPARKKRASSPASEDEDDKDEDGDADKLLSDTDKEPAPTETPLSSSPHIRSSQTKRLRISTSSDKEDDEMDLDEDEDAQERNMDAVLGLSGNKKTADGDDDEDEDDMPVARPARRRVIGGFIEDSSDEE